MPIFILSKLVIKIWGDIPKQNILSKFLTHLSPLVGSIYEMNTKYCMSHDTYTYKGDRSESFSFFLEEFPSLGVGSQTSLLLPERHFQEKEKPAELLMVVFAAVAL